MSSEHRRHRYFTIGLTMSATVFFIAAAGLATVVAGDSSYGRVVSRLRSEYRATDKNISQAHDSSASSQWRSFDRQACRRSRSRS